MLTIEDIQAWKGRTLHGADGDKIGEVTDDYLVRESGEPEWLGIETGGPLGKNVSFVPLRAVSDSGEDIRVPYDKALVEDAPDVADHEELTPEEAQALYAHYSLEDDELGDPDGAPAVGHDRSRPNPTAESTTMHRDERETLEAKRDRRGAPQGRAPDSPSDLSGASKMATLKRTFKEFSADNLTDWAAALTYYSVLALFPAIIALVSIIGLVGPSATDRLLENVGQVAPGPAKEILTGAIEAVASGGGAAGIAFIIGLLLALNSASGYIAAFSRASNAIYEIEEGRPIWKLKPAQIATALVLIVLLAVVAIAVTFTGPLAEEAGKVIGVGDSAVTIWDFAKIPVILLVVSFMFAFLYWAAPNVKQPGFKFISPGGVVALVIWIVASLLFALYVAKFASYNKTYGSLGGVIVFLMWLWITNIAILFGAEFNAELQRSQQREAGQRAPLDEPFLEPRDTTKLEKKATKEG